jgi:hypothetical protein
MSVGDERRNSPAGCDDFICVATGSQEVKSDDVGDDRGN